MCKRREKCGSVSSSLDSQKCKRDRERERENLNHPILGLEATLPLEEGLAAPGSLGLSRHLLGNHDLWIEMTYVFPKTELGHKDLDTENQKGHLVPPKGP